jgi:YesN/AraC family two-component response regulator
LAIKYYEHLINWQSYGFEVIGAAYDGKEALCILKERKPDLIITDIKMPVMNGIEFATESRKINPEIHILFVTSYTDFDYTYSALKLGADDYIMKDLISSKVLTEKLLEIKKKFKSERLEDSYKIEKAMEEIFSGKRIDHGQLEWLGNQMQKVLSSKYIALYLKKDRLIPAVSTFFRDESEKNDSGIEAEICRNFADAVFRPAAAFQFADGIVSILKFSSPDTEKLQQYSGQLQSRLEATLHGSYSVFATPRPMTLAEAGSLVSARKSATDAQLFLGRRLILPIDSPRLKVGVLKEAFDIGLMEKYIQAGDIAELKGYLGRYFKKIREVGDASAFDFVFFNCLNFFRKFGENLHDLQSGESFSPEPQKYEMESMYTIPDAMEWILGRFESLLSLKDEDPAKNYSADTLQIIRYIKEHYSEEDLDIDGISKGVAMSIAKSESIFKIETGHTLVDFLNQYRIQKAMNLLENGDRKIYEVSEKVGFSSSQYFSKIFKKYTLMTPIEYRKKVANEIRKKYRN